MRLATDIFGHYVHENLDVISYGVFEFFHCWLLFFVKRESFTIYEPINVTGFIDYAHVSVWPDRGCGSENPLLTGCST